MKNEEEEESGVNFLTEGTWEMTSILTESMCHAGSG